MKFLYRNKKKYFLKTKNSPVDIIPIAMDYILKQLNDAEIKHIETEDNTVNFRGNIFRYIWNGFSMFNPISKGRFSFENPDNNLVLEVELYFTEIFYTLFLFLSTAVVAYFGGLGIIAFMLATAIALIYGLTITIALFRVKYFLFNMISYTDNQIDIQEKKEFGFE